MMKYICVPQMIKVGQGSKALQTRVKALLSKESSACAGLGCFGTLCRAMTDCFADGKIHKKQ